MEIWTLGWSEAASSRESIARCLRLSDESIADASVTVLDIRDGHNEATGTAHVHIASEDQQQKALAHVGLVDWVVLTFEDWSMIPVENVVAAAQGS